MIQFKKTTVFIYSVLLTMLSTLFIICISKQMTLDHVPDEKSVSLTLGFFLIGQFFGFRILNRPNINNKLIQLYFSEMALVVLMLFSLPIYFSVFSILKIFGLKYLTLFIYLYFLGISFCVGFFSGAELPSLVSILGSKEKDWTFILAANYFGLLMAYIFSVSYFIPTYSIYGTANLCAQLSQMLFVLLSLYVFIFQKFRIRFRVAVVLLMIFIGLQVFNFMFNHEKNQQIYLKSKYAKILYGIFSFDNLDQVLSRLNQMPNILSITTKFQTIDLMVAEHQSNIFSLYLNGHLQFSQSSVARYHEIFSASAFLYANKKIEHILVLGGGDGILANTILKYADTKIDLIELDQQMILLSTENQILRNLNHDSLINKNVTIHIEDAWAFLQNNINSSAPIKYDLIFCDFPFPNSFDTVKLYSFEFYFKLKQSLSPDGILVFDAPILARHQNVYFKDIVSSTLQKAGFADLRLHGSDEGFFVASAKTLTADYDRIQNHISLKSLFEMGDGRQIFNLEAPINTIYKEMSFE